jgi:hypothetical protein
MMLITLTNQIFTLGVLLWEMLVGDIYFSWMRFSWQIADAVVIGRRPVIPRDENNGDYSNLIGECWHSSPTLRPPFEQILSRLRALE